MAVEKCATSFLVLIGVTPSIPLSYHLESGTIVCSVLSGARLRSSRHKRVTVSNHVCHLVHNNYKLYVTLNHYLMQLIVEELL